jgi:hypothetical protein
MNRRAANTQKVVGDLLLSGLNGQLRPGDTIGLWTFNENLSAGSFPLQRWTPQTRQRIAVAMVEFLQRQRYEKSAQLDKALAPMMGVVKDSDKITVLLISDGADKVSGTPFDGNINEAYKLNYSPQRKLRMPLVTVLRARKGEFIGWNVSIPPWPVEFPAFPVEPQIVKPTVPQEKPKPEEPKPAPTPATVPSIIVTGKKPEPPSLSSTNATLPATAPTPPGELPPPTITTTTQQVAVAPGPPAKSEIVPLPKVETTSSPAPVSVIVPDKPKVQPESSTKPAEPTAPSPAPTSVVQTAVATPSETVFNRAGILIAGVVLLLVALGLVYALTRRSRTAPRVSLITRSMDRDKK